MDELKLTMREWDIAQTQCSQCRLWDQTEGCIYEGRADNLPVYDCLMFDENRKQ